MFRFHRRIPTVLRIRSRKSLQSPSPFSAAVSIRKRSRPRSSLECPLKSRCCERINGQPREKFQKATCREDKYCHLSAFSSSNLRMKYFQRAMFSHYCKSKEVGPRGNYSILSTKSISLFQRVEFPPMH